MRAAGVRAALATALLLQASFVNAAAVKAAHVWSGPESTRVVLELSAPVEHRLFVLADPDRVVIDLPASSATAPLTLPEPKGLVSAVRSGARGDELRVVLELRRPATPRSFLLRPDGAGGHRLVVDLVPGGSAAAPSASAAVATAAVPASAPAAAVVRPASTTVAAAQPIVETVARAPRTAPVPRAAPAAGRELVVAIDAGHGGDDPGALGRGGAREKDVVLAIAKRLAAEIDAEPGMRAVLTRAGDYYVPHRKRMQIAHAAQADFFISIHADSYRDSSAKGATVYVLSEKGASDEAALVLARRENGSDLIGGVSLAEQDQLLARVLLDLSQNAALSASTAAGQRLIRRMSGVTPMRRVQVQQAPFLVLKSPDIPSVLVETAYISNPREEGQLRSASYQAALARALCEGIVDYFRANPPEGSYFSTHTAAVSREPLRHVISRGETLSGIAERYRVSPAVLRRTNSLKGDTIRAGQVLKIPQS